MKLITLPDGTCVYDGTPDEIARYRCLAQAKEEIPVVVPHPGATVATTLTPFLSVPWRPSVSHA